MVKYEYRTELSCRIMALVHLKGLPGQSTTMLLLRNSVGFGSNLASRNYATLKDSTIKNSWLGLTMIVQTRLKAIRNIGKITSSMKMIASTKLNRAQKAMEIGREFGRSITSNQKIILSLSNSISYFESTRR